MTRRLCVAAASVAAALSLLSSPAQAQLLLDFTGGTAVSFNTVQGTAGYDFTVGPGSATFNAIGLWDEGGDGLATGHLVGLWDAGQNLLRSGNVTNAGTPVASTSADGRWIFVSIPTITLTPGTYVLAAVYDGTGGSDPDLIRTNTLASLGANIGLGDTLQDTSGTGLTFPTQALAGLNDGAFGPNLAFIGNGAGAPEPGTLALLAIGVAGGIVARRRK